MPTIADIFAAIDAAKRNPLDYAKGAVTGLPLTLADALDSLANIGTQPGPGQQATLGPTLRGLLQGTPLEPTGTPAEGAGSAVGFPGVGSAVKAGLLAAKGLPTLGLLGQMVYHGTPHEIQGGYDLSKIGTGQGAQSYGHGMYFAEAKPTAQSYRDILGGHNIDIPGGVVISPQPGSVQDQAKAWVETFGSGAKDPFAEAMKTVRDHLSNELPNKQAIFDQIAEWKNAGAKLSKGGKLYSQDLPDEVLPTMLQWDKPLSEQPKAVLESIKKASPGLFHKGNYPDTLTAATDASNAAGYNIPFNEMSGHNAAMRFGVPADAMSGQDYWHLLMRQAGGDTAAAESIKALGIPGLSYLDAGSRGAGSGTMNHVIWDQALLDRMKPQAVE